MSRNIALCLSYDGSVYHGWQIQRGEDTIQQRIQNAASQISDEPVSLIGCGRTDAGVHACVYVASFMTSSGIPADCIPRALNSLLPPDISVSAATDTLTDFHPVRSCERKEYTYVLYRGVARNPFLATRALYLRHPFDTSRARDAAAYFVGTHDFASMRSLGTPVKTTVRTVYSCDIIENGSFVKIKICADGFLYNMARTIAGTLLLVAGGKCAPSDIPDILQSGDRTRAGATAPPQALYMTNLRYPEKYVIPMSYTGGIFDADTIKRQA